MYNVLHIMTGDDGGITSVVRNYYENIDKKKVHFDIACITEDEGIDIGVLRNMGANIFYLPMKSQGLIEYTRELKCILSKNKYSAVHVHENETSFIALRIAKNCGVRHRLAHAHTSSPYVSIVSEIRRLFGVILNYHYATTVIGCGILAGNRVFGKWNMKREKAIVLPNAINFEKFIFSHSVRAMLRSQMGISEKFVIGFVGRLVSEKNILFCLKIIQKIHRRHTSAILIIIGDGSEEKNIRRYITDNRMEEYVFLLGKRTDVELWYQAFDAFILPSIHEGFPLVVVEALASGLPVLLSNNITGEFAFSSKVRYIDLKRENDWVDSLSAIIDMGTNIERSNELDSSVFDIKCVVRKLEEIYLK